MAWPLLSLLSLLYLFGSKKAKMQQRLGEFGWNQMPNNRYSFLKVMRILLGLLLTMLFHFSLLTGPLVARSMTPRSDTAPRRRLPYTGVFWHSPTQLPQHCCGVACRLNLASWESGIAMQATYTPAFVPRGRGNAGVGASACWLALAGWRLAGG